MCGIAGIISRTGHSPDRLVIETMTDAVAHRGPDGSGVWIDGPVALGHRRLAIIDLSSAADQPMRCDASGRQIVFNGEIYNYRELRAQLADGYHFRTASDTEVILAAYDRWGESCVERFNGMWSFAILDLRHDVVFCSRDRFGVKPFYYLDSPTAFAFGSEIRQLLPFLSSRQANRHVLTDYLAFAEDEWGAETFFAGIRRLLPGHNLTVKASTGHVTISRYYRVSERAESRQLGEAEAAEALRALLIDSVRLRLRSDVKVGTCLSGGLDSSSIASVAASLVRDTGAPRFSSITAVSEVAETDEAMFASAVADSAGLNAYFVRPDFAQFSASIGQVVTAQEEPFLSPSVFMQFFVMRESRRQGIPVLLDGQGGDEVLLGYERYVVPALREVRRTQGNIDALVAMRQLARNNRKLALSAQLLFLAYFSDSTFRWIRSRQRLGNPSWFPSLRYFREKYGSAPASMFELQRQQVEVESVPHLLRYEDKNSMRHSVETRLPFLDYRVVELGLNLSTATKISGGWTKAVLRQAMRDFLPPSIAWRKSKLGFDAPDARWLPRIREAMINAVTESPLVTDLCEPVTGRSLASRLPNSTLFRFFVASLWAREFGVTNITRDPVL